MRNDYKVPNYYNDMYRQQYPAENWQTNSQSRGKNTIRYPICKILNIHFFLVDNNAYVPDNWPAQFPQQNNVNGMNF